MLQPTDCPMQRCGFGIMSLGLWSRGLESCLQGHKSRPPCPPTGGCQCRVETDAIHPGDGARFAPITRVRAPPLIDDLLKEILAILGPCCIRSRNPVNRVAMSVEQRQKGLVEPDVTSWMPDRTWPRVTYAGLFVADPRKSLQTVPRRRSPGGAAAHDARHTVVTASATAVGKHSVVVWIATDCLGEPCRLPPVCMLSVERQG